MYGGYDGGDVFMCFVYLCVREGGREDGKLIGIGGWGRVGGAPHLCSLEGGRPHVDEDLNKVHDGRAQPREGPVRKVDIHTQDGRQ